jgi:hypothetical protein
MKKTCLLLAAGAALTLTTFGCVNVKAPERIDIGGGRPEPVDTSRVPPITTVEQGRAELARAYQNIQYLEQENRHLKDKADNYKRERDNCRKRLEKYEKD